MSLSKSLRTPGERAIAAIKAALFVAALLPFAELATSAIAYPERLGTNPAEFLIRATGDWALRLLLVTLAVTPFRRLTGWHWLVRLRRMLGLFAFFYAALHLTTYVAFDHVFDLAAILADIVKRPFITIGVSAFVLLIPLAVTSTNAMVRRLGAKRWQALHRMVYVIGILGVVHFWMMVKRDITEPAIYAALLAILLGYRVAAARRARVATQARVRYSSPGSR